MVHPAASVRGRVRPPGDKSISHRYALLASIAEGTSRIRGYSTGGDCQSTLRCLRGLGVRVRQVGQGTGEGLDIEIEGRGLRGLQPRPVCWTPAIPAARSGCCRESSPPSHSRRPSPEMTPLRRRPMRRIIVPLERMGARILSEDGRPPLTIEGTAKLSRHRLHSLTSRARRSRARSCSPVCTPTALLVSIEPVKHARPYGAGAAIVRCDRLVR